VKCEASKPAKHYWAPVAAFVVITYAVSWVALLLLRNAAQFDTTRAFWIFVLVTVWSPTIVALLTALLFNGRLGVRQLLGLLFRRLAQPRSWYVVAVVVPLVVVCAAITIARMLHDPAPFIPVAAFPLTIAMQAGTGAVGEELGWRGFFLSQLQLRFSDRRSAAIMAVTWSLWHVSAFLFPGMPQILVPPMAFLTAVAAFGFFLALIFRKTQQHVLGSIMAHFTFNLGLAIGGARFGAVLWWSLASLFGIVAIWSVVRLGDPESPLN
jgi:membrane protease YdiL (CAAX protease family)